MTNLPLSGPERYRDPKLRVFIRDVSDNKTRQLEVQSWATVKDVKDMISGIVKSGETLYLDYKSAPTSSPFMSPRYKADLVISSSMKETTPNALKSIVNASKRGLSVNLKPELVLDGSGGTYYFRAPNKDKIAVFKPSDEEPYAANNPRGYLLTEGHSMALRDGVVPGEACIREVAAYLLDKDGFSGVPMTTLVEAGHPSFNTNGAHFTVAQGGASMGSHSTSPHTHADELAMKPGSFQEFIRSECTMDDISPTKIPVSEVHKIAILDIRIMNADRNAANLLVRRRRDNSLELVPIDHGYCLRSVCNVSWMDWCWLDWPQLKQPLSKEHVRYVKNLDIEAEAKLLHEQLNICEEAIDYFRASSALLKAGVEAGLSLYDIAVLCCRNDNLAEIPSMMEKLFGMAGELANSSMQIDRWDHTTASRALMDQLSAERRPSLANFSKDKASPVYSRSMSSTEFSRCSMTLSDGSFTNRGSLEGSPEMAQSSTSSCESESEETSSLHQDEEKQEEAIEGWAVITVARVASVQLLPSARSTRAPSVGSSDDGSHISADGFWTVRPGSERVNDDDSFRWSPGSSCHGVLDLTDGLEVPFALGGGGKENNDKPSKPTSVKFAPGPFFPPATVNVATKSPDMDSLDVLSNDGSSSGGGMRRSKSYSALPSKEHGVVKAAPKKHTDDYDTYKTYFHNFIDLVIACEVSKAAHYSKHP